MDDAYLMQELGISQPQPDVNGVQGAHPFDLTTEDMLGMTVPGYTDDTASPQAASPSQVDVPAQPVPQTVSGPITSPAQTDMTSLPSEWGGGSVSSSSKGFSPQKYTQIQKGPSGDLARANAASKEQVAADASAMMGVFDTARQQGADAIQSQTQAQVDYDTELAGQHAWMAGKQQEFATKEAEAHAQAQALLAQTKANYIAALNDYRSSGVDPSQLWNHMGKGEQVGMLATAFVQDFLGAQGIKTSAMDTLNRAIDRNINSQLEGIRIKGDVAQGFKQVWDMQRAESASDEEARARVRGFMLDSFKLKVEEHMAQFSSGLTMAKGQAAIAKLNAEQAKNIFDVYQYADQSTRAYLQQNLSKYATDLQNSQQAYANRTARMHAENEAKKLAAEKAPKPISSGDFIIDPETNQAKFVFRDGTRPEEKADIKKRSAALEDVNRNMVKLRTLARKLEPKLDGTPNRLTDEDNRLYAALQIQLAKSSLAARGERATDKDAEQELLSYPRETKLTKGGVEKILANTQENTIRSAQSYIRQFADDVPEGTYLGPNGQILQASLTDATNTATGEAGKLSPDQKAAKDAGELASGPAAFELNEVNRGVQPPSYIMHAQEQFRQKYPEQAVELAKQVRGASGGHDGVSNAEYGIAHLANEAAMGNTAALKQLEFLAKSYRRGDVGSEKDVVGALASMHLGNLSGESDPEPSPSPLQDYGLSPEEAQSFMNRLTGGVK